MQGWLDCSRFKPAIIRADIPHNSDLLLKNVINIFKHLKTLSNISVNRPRLILHKGGMGLI